MRKYIESVRTLAFSETAKDTYVIFSGNILSAFFGFVFTWFIARNLDVSEFGMFSALSNLVFIIAPLTDIGLSSGIIRYVASLRAKKDYQKAMQYVKAGLIIKAVVLVVIFGFLFSFPQFVTQKLLASDNPQLLIWVLLISLGYFLPGYIPFVLQAERKFVRSAIIDPAYSIFRIGFVVFLGISGLTLIKTLKAFTMAGAASLVVIAFVYGYSFLKVRVEKKVYKNLLKFSSWLAVNKIMSSISGKIDVQMLAAFSGATITGYYSISNRLAFFITLLTASYGAVISPRLAAFEDVVKEKRYIIKSLFAIVLISLGVVFWAVIAEPFITILFGVKYLPSVGYFRALAISMIPFLFTAPSVSAIIYSIRKPKYIGYFSIIQTLGIIGLNYLFIPKFGAYGPSITFGIMNTLLLLYSWIIVIGYYWNKNEVAK